MSQDFKGCPHCLNQIGFAFGTCSACGYNYVEHRFRWIKVYVDDLDSDEDILVEIHAGRTFRRSG